MTEPAHDRVADPTAAQVETPLGPDQLWRTDTGTLSAASRRALVRLLQGPLVRADKQPEVWKAILSDETELRSRLSDVFLDLVLDEASGIAFTRMVDADESVSVPKVLRAVPLNHIDTVVLLHLRTELAMAQPGERVIVDKEEVFEALEVYRVGSDRDEKKYRTRFDASFKRIGDYNLISTTETEGRFEVSPVLKSIFDPDIVAGIRDEYLAMSGGPGSSDGDGAGGDPIDVDAAFEDREGTEE
ncbi:DUF4194 domain-containing protein [Corynebacterium xerosis]|uniref:DUF4194 domain-containing protein n=1 Tax=Corynebacterium xerosis TaxID=1725 RepID=UPI0036567696